jgi:hypothetical protein
LRREVRVVAHLRDSRVQNADAVKRREKHIRRIEENILATLILKFCFRS